MKIIISLLIAAALWGCGTTGTTTTGTNPFGLDQATYLGIEQLAFQYAVIQLSQSTAVANLQKKYPAINLAAIQQIVAQQFAQAKPIPTTPPKATPKPKA